MQSQSSSTTSNEPLSKKIPLETSLRDKERIIHSITVGKKPEEVFTFWRHFENLAYFMKDIHRIEVSSPTRSHWEVQLKSGMRTEWDAEITEEIPGRSISWRSLDDSAVKTVGTVSFEPAPADLGTIVRLSIHYKVPGGKLTELAAFMTGETPDILVLTNLKRLKAFLETGEIATTEGQPNGKEPESESLTTTLQH